jgi:hypothetical protein
LELPPEEEPEEEPEEDLCEGCERTDGAGLREGWECEGDDFWKVGAGFRLGVTRVGGIGLREEPGDVFSPGTGVVLGWPWKEGCSLGGKRTVGRGMDGWRPVGGRVWMLWPGV